MATGELPERGDYEEQGKSESLRDSQDHGPARKKLHRFRRTAFIGIYSSGRAHPGCIAPSGRSGAGLRPPDRGEIRGAGRKIIQITYNTAIFLVLTGVGLLFIAYAIGVRSGRARAIAEIPMRPPAQESVFVERETPPPIPASANILAPEPEKMWTIKLLEWTGQTARDRVKAQQNAERIKKSLTQNGFRASYYQLVTRNGKKFVVLRYGRFAERSGSEARKMLERLRAFKYRGIAHFARAGLETIDKD